MIKKIALLGTLLCLSHSSFAKWKTLTPSGKATARHESGLVAHNKQVFVVGGRGVKAIDVYDPAKNAWSNNKPTPFEMHHITPVSVGDKILVITGLTGRYPKEHPLTHIWEYLPNKDEWRQGMEIPKERRRGGAGITVHQGKVYLVGGIKLGHTSGTSNMVDVYDPAKQSWRQLTDAPHIRDHANAAIVDNKLIAFGGRNSSYHEPKNFTAFFAQVNDKIDVYDFELKAWHTISSRLPLPTAGAGAVIYGDRLFYVGGEFDQKLANNRTFSFDFGLSQWSEESKLNRGRHGTNAVLIDNKMYIAMGSGNKGGSPELNSIEVFEIK